MFDLMVEEESPDMYLPYTVASDSFFFFPMAVISVMVNLIFNFF